jgi:uncharacterized protein with GYD domain
MKTYVTLLTFTEQGARNLKQSPQRANEFRQAAERSGVKVLVQLWTAGKYDGVLILQAENEEKILTTLVQLAALGNVHTHSLRAFDGSEWNSLVNK